MMVNIILDSCNNYTNKPTIRALLHDDQFQWPHLRSSNLVGRPYIVDHAISYAVLRYIVKLDSRWLSF